MQKFVGYSLVNFDIRTSELSLGSWLIGTTYHVFIGLLKLLYLPYHFILVIGILKILKNDTPISNNQQIWLNV